MARSPVTVSYARAKDLFDKLINALRANLPPYNLPEAHVPQEREFLAPSIVWGSPEHAIFLFHLCYYMKGRIDSIEAVRKLAMVYERCPQLFNPHCAMLMDSEYVTQTLIAVGFKNSARQVGKPWVENARRLVARYNGDILGTMRNVHSYKQACRVLRNDKRGGGFIGFQYKMTSMLLYYFMNCGLMKYFVFPIPIDFHAFRLLKSHGALRFEGSERNVDDSLSAPLRRISVRYCRETGISALDLCTVLWIHSRVFCDRHPGNIMRKSPYAARRTALEPKPYTWTQSKIKSYEKTCGKCSVVGTCTENIPSKPYYARSRLVVLGKITTPPQGDLFIPHGKHRRRP